MDRRSCLSLLGLVACSRAAVAAPAAPAVWRLGVAPHTSARVIVQMYQPLRLHLQQELGVPVEVVTASDFTEYARRALAGQYDLAVTTGHQARLLQSDAGYLPLRTYQADFRAVAVVKGTAPYRRAADLAGGEAAGLSPSSLVTLWGQHWLTRNAVPHRPMQYVSAADSLAQLVLKDEAAVGFMSLANFQQLAPAVQAQLRILEQSVPMAGRVYLLHPRLAARVEDVDAALESFAKTPEAAAYFERYKLEGYRRLGPRELDEMEPYAAEVREVLRRSGPAPAATRAARP